jgi:hypothetical protein
MFIAGLNENNKQGSVLHHLSNYNYSFVFLNYSHKRPIKLGVSENHTDIIIIYFNKKNKQSKCFFSKYFVHDGYIKRISYLQKQITTHGIVFILSR